jgi:hypothetical protein
MSRWIVACLLKSARLLPYTSRGDTANRSPAMSTS